MDTSGQAGHENEEGPDPTISADEPDSESEEINVNDSGASPTDTEISKDDGLTEVQDELSEPPTGVRDEESDGEGSDALSGNELSLNADAEQEMLTAAEDLESSNDTDQTAPDQSNVGSVTTPGEQDGSAKVPNHQHSYDVGELSPTGARSDDEASESEKAQAKDVSPLDGFPSPPEGPLSPLQSDDGGQAEHGVRWWLTPQDEVEESAEPDVDPLDGGTRIPSKPAVEINRRDGDDGFVENTPNDKPKGMMIVVIIISVAVLAALIFL